MADRVHRALGISAVAIVVAGLLGWRSLRGGAGTSAAAAIPNIGITDLLPYATPVADSTRVITAASAPAAPVRDPFAAQATARPPEPRAGVTRTALPRIEKGTWHVTTTLLSGSRRAALINDELIYVGDPLPDGSRLTTVEHDHVVVTDQKGAAHTVAVAKEGNG